MPVAFSGKEFTFHDPDGSEIRVRGWGNQYRAVFETLDGFTVIKHPETGYFHLAALSEDGTRLVPTDERVATVSTVATNAPKHIRPIRQEARRTRDEPGQQPRWETRREQRRARRRDALESDAEAEPPEPGTVGDYIGLCLLIRFPDVPDTVLRTEVERFCNQPGYSSSGNNGSVYDYFLDNSGGALRYTNVVTAYYTSKKNRDYYTAPTVERGIRARELVVEALDDLRHQGFDFTQLSADDEGCIHALNALYAGDCVNQWGEGLWPMSDWLDDYHVPGGIKHHDYQITNIGSELLLDTFCHENGHMICSFPDLYDYANDHINSSGVGQYCLMGQSPPNGRNPIQICAYLKNEAELVGQTHDHQTRDACHDNVN